MHSPCKPQPEPPIVGRYHRAAAPVIRLGGLVLLLLIMNILANVFAESDVVILLERWKRWIGTALAAALELFGDVSVELAVAIHLVRCIAAVSTREA